MGDLCIGNGDQIRSIKPYHSFHTTRSSGVSRSPSRWKSDINFVTKHDLLLARGDEEINTGTTSKEKEYEDYYKRYEHDDLPVKDDSSFNDHSFSEDNNSGLAENKDSITNSDLDKLELKILRTMSQKLQTEDDSVSSLESNIKLFKTTVQQIFDNFYDSMRDFDLYKKKFNDILEKTKGDSVAEMEDFIKDMIRNIGSSNSSVSNNSKVSEKSTFGETVVIDKDNTNEVHSAQNHSLQYSLNSDIQSYKNGNYSTDSTLDGNSSKFNADSTEDTFNIYLLSNNPCVEIKMNNRSLLSEINIREHLIENIKGQLASAENIKKRAAKKLELNNYDKHRQEQHVKDKEIPVKISNPKKDIFLDQDFFDTEKKESNHFFMFKICSYICKKLRKNTLG